jgi:hypothetical protein
MTEFFALFTGGWGWLAGIGLAACALIGSYFGGKKIGTTQTQAKADVTAAKVESQQVADVAQKQTQNAEKANSVKTSNASLTDSASRDKLRKSQFNSDD